MQRRRSSSWRIEVYLVLGAIAVLGVVAAPLPFTGDQALFAAGARQIADGDVLYRDFWDVKQPGIYFFYLVGGTMFGYSEVALHLFELGYQLAFAVVLMLTLRGVFRHRWIAPLVALLILGTYYATVEPVELGQVESLVGFPLYLTLWCAVQAVGGVGRKSSHRVKHTSVRTRWLVASGLAGGLVLLLKLVLAPVVGGIWLLAAWQLARAVPRHRWRAVASAVAAVAVGVLIPVVITVAYLAAHGQLGTVRWTFFNVTSQATAIAGRPVSRLIEGGFKTGVRWAFPLALATIAVVVAVRRGWDRLQVGLVAWIALGVPVFLVQHWWIYTYAMFLVPVGVLAGYGLDVVVDAWSRARAPLRLVAVAVAILLLVPAGLRFATNGRDVARHDFALSTEGRAGLRTDLEPNYEAAVAWAAWLRAPTTAAGGVYVLGNPLNLYLSDREQTVSINGWSPEQYPEDVWARLRHELREARPVHVVVDEFSDSIMRDRSPETRRLIASQYEHVGQSGPDSWYQLREPLPAAG